MKKVFGTAMKVLVAAMAICLLPVWGKEVKADDPQLYGVLCGPLSGPGYNDFNVTFYYGDMNSYEPKQQDGWKFEATFPYVAPNGNNNFGARKGSIPAMVHQANQSQNVNGCPVM